MADPAELYKNFAHISDVQMQSLTGGGYGLSASRYQHTLQSWAVAGQDEAGVWYRYYLAQIDSTLQTAVAGTFKINEYGLTLHLVNDTSQLLENTQLIEVTPDTTQGSTSYTTSMNQSFSASGGFFGESPTMSLGASVSFGHSVTRSIPDITIENRSLGSDGQNASWALLVAEGAPAQGNTMEFTTQALFRIPSKPADPSSQFLRLEFRVGVEDHDNNGTGYHDRTMDQVRPHLGDIQVSDLGDRGMWLNFPALEFGLKSPSIPQP